MKVADAIIINEDKKILLVKRRANTDEGGLWSIPGGTIESNESVEQGVMRELNEELLLNISITDADLFKSYNLGSVTAYYYIVYLPDNMDIVLNDSELDAFDFFSLDEIKVLGKLAFNQNDVIEDYEGFLLSKNNPDVVKNIL